MAKEQWTAVRVSHDTKARLEQKRQTWIDNDSQMPRPLGSEAVRSGAESTRDEIGLDQVIRALLDYHDRHADRRRKAAQRRRQSGKAIAKDEPSVDRAEPGQAAE